MYHIPRHQSNKSLPTTHKNINHGQLIYSTAIPQLDSIIAKKACEGYWWLFPNQENEEEPDIGNNPNKIAKESLNNHI